MLIELCLISFPEAFTPPPKEKNKIRPGETKEGKQEKVSVFE